MSTDKPRIQAYVEPQLHKQFLEWKRELGIAKDSEALNQLLAEYFRKTPESSSYTSQFPTREELRILIQEELWTSGKRDFIEGIKLEAQAIIAKQISETKAYWEELNSLELIKDFRMRLEDSLEALAERLKAVEDSLEVVLSELSSHSLESLKDTRFSDLEPEMEAPGLEEDKASIVDVEGDAGKELVENPPVASESLDNSPQSTKADLVALLL